MLFNSFEFLLFFPIVTIIYFLLPHKYRWLHLLLASCVFYMYFVPIYILILIFTIIIDYVAGILIENEEGKRRRFFLVMSIVANVGVLAIFKYYNFFVYNTSLLFRQFHWGLNLPLLKILLPIGLSFHTFQAMSYTIEVYRGNQKAERHFGIYALYVMFYPQLVAGPIERPQNLLHQFHRKCDFNYDNLAAGLRQIMWGLFKKSIIADRLALILDPVINHPTEYSGTSLCMAMFFFAYQIYCDFSGYSDIALGAAKVMGFDLMVNFDHPFRSRSVSEFWRRWHRSLSTWLGDYVFKPTAIFYRGYGMWGVIIASMGTFLISGLWHGAAWKFIIWGALHGIALSYEVLTQDFRDRFFQKIPTFIRGYIGKLFTFSFLCFTWIYFRANSINDANLIIKKIMKMLPEINRSIHDKKLIARYLFLHVSPASIIIGLICICVLELIQYFERNAQIFEIIAKKPKVVRWVIYMIFFVVFVTAGEFNNRQFIYFQF